MVSGGGSTIRGERLAEALRSIGMSQAELARRIGIKQPSIAALISGKSQATRHLHAIAKIVRVTPDYLTGETDNPRMTVMASTMPAYRHEGMDSMEALSPALMAEELGAVMVPQLAMGYSMGGGSVLDEWQQTRMVPLPQFWLGSVARGSMADLFIAPGQGDSMLPTLLDGDLCLIDRAQQRLDRQDGLWCLTYSGFGMIKRVRALPDGGYQINSDNPAVSPITAYDDEMHLVGRVVWIMRKA